MILDLYCKECDSEVEVYCNADDPMMCPECRSIDCFTEIEKDCKFCHGTALSQYSNDKPCVYCRD